MLTKEMVSRYRVSERTYHLPGSSNKRDVEIVRLGQLKGPDKWAIKIDDQFALLKDGKIYYEPIPSSRSDEYLNQSRFSTPESAYEHYMKFQHKIHGPFQINEFQH